MKFHVNLTRNYSLLNAFVPIGARGFTFTSVLGFVSPLDCGFLEYSSSERICVLQLFQLQSAKLLWYSSHVTVVIRHRERGVSYKHALKSQSFSGLASLTYDLQKCSFCQSTHPHSVRKEVQRGLGRERNAFPMILRQDSVKIFPSPVVSLCYREGSGHISQDYSSSPLSSSRRCSLQTFTM